MPAPFRHLTLPQFAELLGRFTPRRRVNAVHLHHSRVPSGAEYHGEASIEAIWRRDTRNFGLSDTAQHVTIAPDGMIWLGRNWERPPVSAAGHNGSPDSGPLMIEIIGDFDQGRDRFEGSLRDTAIEVIARVQKKWGLAPSSLIFHSMMSKTTCPGNTIDYPATLGELEAMHRTLEQGGNNAARNGGGPFAANALEGDEDIEHAIRALATPSFMADDPPDAGHDDDIVAASAAGRTRAPLAPLTAGDLQSMRPYVVNLNMGGFSDDGLWKSSASDVDTIFGQHLEAALQGRQGSRPLRIVVFLHGGLVGEAVGLQVAHKALQWWKDNDVYPLYIVWETGAFETIGQLLTRAQSQMGVSRDIFDFTTDPLIETTVRALKGPLIWGGMKLSALLASQPPAAANANTAGGGWYVANRLGEFCKKHPGEVEVHAVGHSAGSIFHSYFIPAALQQGVPAFKTASFLAPAVRMDLFKSNLLRLVGNVNGIGNLAIFTMSKDLEKADNCASIYRKSLLYLIYHALEPESKTPILGLEESLRADPDLAPYLAFQAQRGLDVVWSTTDVTSGRSASESRSHGDFDDDRATMNSVLRRLLGKTDGDPINDYVEIAPASRCTDAWCASAALPAQVQAFQRLQSPQPFSAPEPLRPSAPSQSARLNAAQPAAGWRPIVNGAGSGRRRALCVGVDRYPSAPLGGCVADALAWKDALMRLGFETPTMLLDARATRANIVAEIGQLIDGSQDGDVIAFQYSGHGTQLPDLNGDEAQGDSPGQDEAICPVDYESGAFLIDDDIGELCDRLPAGVNLTIFADCCHSGTISRFAVSSGNRRASNSDARPRFIVANDAMIQAHARFRGSRGVSGPGGVHVASRAPGREILFAACLSHEVAWESNGHGAFTDRALRVLANNSAGSLTNALFAQQIVDAFGPNAQQHPKLYGMEGAAGAFLLQPVNGAGTSNGETSAPSRAGTDHIGAAITALQTAAAELAQLRG
jgi:hypothetical protein